MIVDPHPHGGPQTWSDRPPTVPDLVQPVQELERRDADLSGLNFVGTSHVALAATVC